MMEERTEITPYRMSQLVKAASNITEQICGTKGVLHVTYDEMKIILKVIEMIINESIDHNKEIKQEEAECLQKQERSRS